MNKSTAVGIFNCLEFTVGLVTGMRPVTTSAKTVLVLSSGSKEYATEASMVDKDRRRFGCHLPNFRTPAFNVYINSLLSKGLIVQ